MSSHSTPIGETTNVSPAGIFTSILDAAVAVAATKLERKVAQWADKLDAGGSQSGRGVGNLHSVVEAGLDGVAKGGGATQAAAAHGVKAHWQGNNPIWAAVHAAWKSGTPAVKATIIAALTAAIVLVLVSPVLCLVFLLSLLVISAIQHAGHARA
jgi:hypothetical protein